MVTYYQYEFDDVSGSNIFKWEHSGFHELKHQNSHVTLDHDRPIEECIAALQEIYPHDEHTATTKVHVEKRQLRTRDKRRPDVWIIKAHVEDELEGVEAQAGDFTAALTKLYTELDGEAKRIKVMKKDGQGYQK